MHGLDNIKLIRKIDCANMYGILSRFPEHCRQAFKLGQNFNLFRKPTNIKNIIFCGMGGSAIGAEIISYYLRDELSPAICVNRDYSLPGFVDKDSLLILISYSGNTEETLSAYKEAKDKGAEIVVLTSGGQLAESAKTDGYNYLLIPSGFPPRQALAFLSLPVLVLFFKMGFIREKEKELEETVEILKRLRDKSLDIEVKADLNPAKRLARRLFDNFCVIYAASEHLAGVVTRWRGQLAENSKTLSSSHVFPEMNHNEIVGWQHPEKLLKRFMVVILRDKGEHIQVKKRIEISKEILQKEGIKVEEVCSEGESLLARIFSLIYIGDFTSFYLAILNGEDPTPVKRIDYLKRRLKEWK